MPSAPVALAFVESYPWALQSAKADFAFFQRRIHSLPEIRARNREARNRSLNQVRAHAASATSSRSTPSSPAPAVRLVPARSRVGGRPNSSRKERVNEL